MSRVSPFGAAHVVSVSTTVHGRDRGDRPRQDGLSREDAENTVAMLNKRAPRAVPQ